MFRKVLIWGVFIAVIIIMGRLILGSPIIANIGVTEMFATEKKSFCPAGTTEYGYNEGLYCCSEKPNPNAGTLMGSCKAKLPEKDSLIFCTLGASENGVKNCALLKNMILDKEGAAVCPKSKPYYVSGDVAKCCAGPGNPQRTDCGGDSCTVTGQPFKDDKNCQFLRMKEESPCPNGYDVLTRDKKGFYVAGCTNNTQVCYSASMLERLKEMGHSVAGMTPCNKVIS